MNKLYISVLLLVLLGSGCSNDTQDKALISSQREEIEALTQQIERLSEPTDSASPELMVTPVTSPYPQRAPSPSKESSSSDATITTKNNPQILIEKCKTEASLSSDSEQYVSIDEINSVMKQLCGEGRPSQACSTQGEQVLNDLSDKRKVAAYNQAYLNCLSQ